MTYITDREKTGSHASLPFNSEIERLLYVQKTLDALIRRAHQQLGADFPKSAAAAGKLAEVFDRELEQALLTAYDAHSAADQPSAKAS